MSNMRMFYRTAEQVDLGSICYTLWIPLLYPCFLMCSKVQADTLSKAKKKEVLKFTLLFVQMKAFLMIFTLALLLLTTTYYYANSSYLMEHLWRWIEPILTIVYLSN